jgi:hypothetical protein
MERVTRRNLAQVPSFRGLSPVQAKARVDANDRINAELVARCRDSADLVLELVLSSTGDHAAAAAAGGGAVL